MSEDEARAAQAAAAEYMKRVSIGDVVISTVQTLIELGYRRTGLVQGAADERDLPQTEVAIEAVSALVPVLERMLDPASVTAVRGAEEVDALHPQLDLLRAETPEAAHLDDEALRAPVRAGHDLGHAAHVLDGEVLHADRLAPAGDRVFGGVKVLTDEGSRPFGLVRGGAPVHDAGHRRNGDAKRRCGEDGKIHLLNPWLERSANRLISPWS